MNTNTPTPSSSLSSIPCAVMYAANVMMVAIPSRENRFPVRITSTSFPLVAWESADGEQECIELKGDCAHEDHANVVDELQRGELLVAEVNDLKDPENSIAKHWLMSAEPQQETERAR